MTTRQRALARTKVSQPRIDAASIIRCGFSRTLTCLDGMILGGSTPRGYRREGYPEIELHQLMSGRRDRSEDR